MPPDTQWWFKPTLTVDEAAPLLSLSRSGMYEACRRGEIPHLKFGARVVILTTPLMKLLELQTEEGASQAPSPTPTSTPRPSVSLPSEERKDLLNVSPLHP